ncbi:MAG: hypothetical protein MUC49_16680 [Raineya sp.]|jgi:hypothetical protein|nr:hypothetical protein [Raineya sp.]
MKDIKLKGIDTEGVLLIVSANQMQSIYSQQKFDYNYPEGLYKLISTGHLYAVTTQESISELCIYDVEPSPNTLKNCILVGDKNFLQVEKNDTWLVIDHASFTMVCDCEKGDYTQEKSYKPLILPFEEGIYQVFTYQKKSKGLPKITLVLKKIENFEPTLQQLKPLEIYD